MKARKALSIGLFSFALILAGLSTASGNLLDEYAALEDGTTDPSSGVVQCLAMCSGGEINVTICASGTHCCGWVNCGTGGYQNSCCPPGYTCHNGTGSTPPSQPFCAHHT